MIEISHPTDGKNGIYGHDGVGHQNAANMMVLTESTEPFAVSLPRRSGESPLAPSQYYYPASKTGVVPSGRFNM